MYLKNHFNPWQCLQTLLEMILVNTNERISFYTQCQRQAARVLFILLLLVSVVSEDVLAAPQRNIKEGLDDARSSVDPCREEQGKRYLIERFQSMNRPVSNDEMNALLTAVGRIPQNLELAASYLQVNTEVTIQQYIGFLNLQPNRHSPIGPALALNLGNLSAAGQHLMQYIAYLDAYIPCSLVNDLPLPLIDKQLAKLMRELADRSLVQLVEEEAATESQVRALQVAPEVQAACRDYQSQQADAKGNKEAILSVLAEVLATKMPWVGATPDQSWQEARSIAPHVVKVVEALKDSEVLPPTLATLLATLLERMGQYNNEVMNNPSQAGKYYNDVLK